MIEIAEFLADIEEHAKAGSETAKAVEGFVMALQVEAVRGTSIGLALRSILESASNPADAIYRQMGVLERQATVAGAGSLLQTLKLAQEEYNKSKADVDGHG